MTLPGGLRASLRRLRARRGRSLVAALGIAAAAAMVGTAVTVGYSLSTGFDRAAVARRPARRDRPLHARSRSRWWTSESGRCRTCVRAPIAASSPVCRSRQTATCRGVGCVQTVGPGRRGYAIVAGRDLRAPGEVVVERGVAREWHIRVGEPIDVGRRQAARGGRGGVARQRGLPAGQRPAGVRERATRSAALHPLGRARTWC